MKAFNSIFISIQLSEMNGSLRVNRLEIKEIYQNDQSLLNSYIKFADQILLIV